MYYTTYDDFLIYGLENILFVQIALNAHNIYLVFNKFICYN